MKITNQIRLTMLAGLCMLISGCASDGSRELTTIRSIPNGAYLEIGFDKRTCTTPCSIKLDRPQRIEVSKEGFEKQVFYIQPNNRDVFVKLELVAASEDVESTQLPDL